MRVSCVTGLQLVLDICIQTLTSSLAVFSLPASSLPSPRHASSHLEKWGRRSEKGREKEAVKRAESRSREVFVGRRRERARRQRVTACRR